MRATDAGEANDRHFLVMEYIAGINLSQLIKSHGPLAINDACELVRQAAVGLQHAYQANLVHRDIKPSNLILSHDGHVKILDLGLARLQDDNFGEGELTAFSERLGTPDYMAPEQAGAGSVDVRADIYSLGCTLYALLTGQAPFAHHTTPLSKAMAHAQECATPIEIRRTDTPQELASVLRRMVAKAPDDRYRMPQEVADTLEPFTSGANLTGLLDSAVESEKPHVPETAHYSALVRAEP